MADEDEQVSMMSHLQERGILCQYENNFSGLLKSTGRLGRIDCARHATEHAFYAKFWIHKGPDFWYFGLWNGLLFSVKPNADIAALVEYMLDVKLRQKTTSIPCYIPKKALKLFGMAEVTVESEVVSPEKKAEALERLRLRRLASKNQEPV